MKLRLVYSNTTENLSRELIADLSAWRSQVGALEPAVIVAPNRNVEDWLRFELARETGIAANLQVLQLRRFLRELAAGARNLCVVDADALQGLLLSLLLDEDELRAPELQPVRAYLHAEGTHPRSVDLRRHQLALQLARLFEEYAYSRPEMLERWREGTWLHETEGASTERWQRALWLRLFADDGLAERRRQKTGIEWISYARLLERLSAGTLGLPRRVHLFGVSYMARLFHRALAEIARRSELCVYTLNPCREFWEDLRTGARPDLSGAQEDPFGLDRSGDTPALRLWGRPGRENIRLLNEMSECDFHEAFDEAPHNASLLARLREDILNRAPERSAPPEDVPRQEKDRSVSFLPCPSMRREAETIAAEIWALVRDDERLAPQEGREPLRFNDIAVLVPPGEREEYFAHLSAAFRDAHEIPHCVVDAPFAGASRVAEAAQMLLAIPLGRYTRGELLPLLTHPVVQARFPGADADDWARWCDKLGILHGADHADHAGTYIDEDLLNWDQGVRRLALGVFLAGERSGRRDAFAVEGGFYLPHELTQSKADSVAQFGRLIRALIADARFAASAELTLAEWASFFRGLVDAYLAAPSGNRDDERDLERLDDVFSSLARLDVDERKVSYTLAHALTTEALEGVTANRGQYLAGGVVVATCQPMRALPFRAIFMAGLGEGRFPASDRRNHLDLRLARRQPGDVSAREQDKYMFLETLLCAREKIFFSWIARHPLSGEPLEPSSVVAELRGILAKGYVGQKGLDLLERRPRLRRHQEALHQTAFGEAIPAAAKEAAAANLRAEFIAQTRATPSVHVLGEHLGLFALPEPREEADDATVRLSLAALRGFLEDPMQAFARYRLGMGDDEQEDLVGREDEPFASDGFFSKILLTRAFLEGVARAEGDDRLLDLPAVFDELAAVERLSGKMPLGVLGEMERTGHLRLLELWRVILRDHVGQGRLPALEPVRFGAAEEYADVRRPEPPLVLDVRFESNGRTVTRRVELYGQTAPLAGDLHGSVILEARPLGSDPVKRQKRALRAFFDHAALAAHGVGAERNHHAFICSPGDRNPSRNFFRLAPFTQKEAREYLAGLACDLLSGTHAYALPCEAVFKANADGVDLAEAVASVFAKRRTSYGPVSSPELYAPPSAGIAKQMIERRFGPFLQRLTPFPES